MTETTLTTATITAGTTGALASLIAGQTGSLLVAVIALVAFVGALWGAVVIADREGIWRLQPEAPRP